MLPADLFQPFRSMGSGAALQDVAFHISKRHSHTNNHRKSLCTLQQITPQLGDCGMTRLSGTLDSAPCLTSPAQPRHPLPCAHIAHHELKNAYTQWAILALQSRIFLQTVIYTRHVCREAGPALPGPEGQVEVQRRGQPVWLSPCRC